MSGGSWEYMMGVMLHTNGQPCAGRDATGEMGPFTNATYGTQVRQIGSWYQEEAWFVSTFGPWFDTGHAFHGGINAGSFAFHRDHGGVLSWVGFRIALAF